MTTAAELSTRDKGILIEYYDSLIDTQTNLSKTETPILVGLLDYLHVITKQGFVSDNIEKTFKSVHNELNQAGRYR
jgi:hypothetical protein